MHQMPVPWGRYDKVVIAHAVIGSFAWLIVRIQLSAKLEAYC